MENAKNRIFNHVKQLKSIKCPVLRVSFLRSDYWVSQQIPDLTTFQISAVFNELFYIALGFCWHTLYTCVGGRLLYCTASPVLTLYLNIFLLDSLEPAMVTISSLEVLTVQPSLMVLWRSNDLLHCCPIPMCSFSVVLESGLRSCPNR